MLKKNNKLERPQKIDYGFSVGVACLSTENQKDKAQKPRTLHNEGRRMLSLLDKRNPNATIQLELSGRPCFPELHADFSISHSHTMVAVSYIVTHGKNKGVHTGCDIQLVYSNRFHKPIATRCFHEQEQRYIAAASDEAEQATRFCTLWTLKECYLKARGSPTDSVFTMKSVPCFVHNGTLLNHSVVNDLAYFLYECKDNTTGYYILAVGHEVRSPHTYIAPPRLRLLSDIPVYVKGLFHVHDN